MRTSSHTLYLSLVLRSAGRWFVRRILCAQTHANGTQQVAIAMVDASAVAHATPGTQVSLTDSIASHNTIQKRDIRRTRRMGIIGRAHTRPFKFLNLCTIIHYSVGSADAK